MATDRIVSLFDTPLSPRFRRVERVREREPLRDRLDEGDQNVPDVTCWHRDPDADKKTAGITEAQIARLRFELLVAGDLNAWSPSIIPKNDALGDQRQRGFISSASDEL
ncbi:MAG: hypothetical protein KKC43_04545 [Alphaproteobacteria bacterium]|nr:hypothetical protein [Alphaproteobacteria bacterium]